MRIVIADREETVIEEIIRALETAKQNINWRVLQTTAKRDMS